MAVQGGEQSIPCKIAAVGVFFGLFSFVWLGFLNNLIFKQNLSLERVEGSFPREMRQGEEMVCLRSKPVKNHMAGSFQDSEGNEAINPAGSQNRQVSVDLCVNSSWARLKN